MFRFLRPFVVFDPDDVPAVTPPAAPAPVAEVPAPAPQPGPWDADLAVFEDPALRQQVDGFMREKVQPRMTQLETQLAERRAAHELYDDLSGDTPEVALKQVIGELYPDTDIAEKFAELLVPAAPPEPVAPTAEVPAPVELPPELAELLEERRAAKEAEDYNRELERIQAAHPDLTIEDELFAPFVGAAEGDFDVAVELFRNYEQRAAQRYGPTPEPTPDPPATLTNPAAPAPPAAPSYASMDDAMDAMFAEIKDAPPAPMGVV